MTPASSNRVISTILKHDAKVTSYKIALLRAINDVVLSFPDLRTEHQDVAIPLSMIAQFWVAYYWPFVQEDQPIWQGQRATFSTSTKNDLAFRPALTKFRLRWEQLVGGISSPADGFFAINELRVFRKRQSYPPQLLIAYNEVIASINKTLEQPIRYAGPGEWTVFSKPIRYCQLQGQVAGVPGTQPQDRCLIITADLWQTFQAMSLWVEALCIHEWCLFSETVQGQQVNRGQIYSLLTARPNNRRPLTWERNQVDLLLMEGTTFICPWTEQPIYQGVAYNLDHLLPIAVYPVNELWNLIPADPNFNSHKKRDRLPSLHRLELARPHLEMAYRHYSTSKALHRALQEDVAICFVSIQQRNAAFPVAVAGAVVELIEQVAESRNLARF